MVANIAMIEGRAAMAYAGEMPWHRLGTKMIGFPNVEAAMAAASLDWRVELEQMYVAGGATVPMRRAVVRDNDRAILATVGTDYVPLQNHDAFGVLNVACKEFGVTIETAGALGNGDRVWMLAKLPESIEPIPGDRIDGYFLVYTGHNGWTSYCALPTPTRVVCQNTVNVALKEGKSVVRLRHTKSHADQLDVVAALVTNLIGVMKLTGESFTKLAKKHLTEKTIDNYIERVLGIQGRELKPGVMSRRRDSMKRLTREGKGVELAPSTAWTAYNAVTEHVDHVRTAKTMKSLRAADVSAVLGPAAKLKRRALELALALV